jgi:crossover junction endodeoxyribonuclease RuvC
MMLILGIDPGATGAAALLGANDSGDRANVIDLDGDPAVLTGRLDSLLASAGQHQVQAVVERAQAMPKQGVAGLAGYMTVYGVILGWLATRHVPYDTVHPATWKKAMGLSGEKGEKLAAKKARSLALARRLFPDADLDRSKDHNRAEALLLAEWARRTRFAKVQP